LWNDRPEWLDSFLGSGAARLVSPEVFGSLYHGFGLGAVEPLSLSSSPRMPSQFQMTSPMTWGRMPAYADALPMTWKPRNKIALTPPPTPYDPATPSTTTDFTGPDDGDLTDLERAIDEATDDPNIRTAMRLAALLEGGSLGGGWGVGDAGMSFGPYQIYTKVHNVTRQQAEDPRFATKYMLPEFQRALAKVDPRLWQTDPMRAAMLTAGHAERPARWGQNPNDPYDIGRVRTAWQALSMGKRVRAPQPTAPAPPSGKVSGWGWFGGRRFEVTGRYGETHGEYRGKPHRGMDIGTPSNTELYAPVEGTVIHAGGDWNRGNYGEAIVIQTATGHRIILGHLNGVSVRPGQRVGPGTMLGRTGSTGYGSGPHLHLEVQDGDGNLVDPDAYFDFR